MKLAFRVDFAPSIGMGHIRRCLTLADEALRLGHQSNFLLSSIDSYSADLITDRGHTVTRIPFTPSSPWNLKNNPNWSDPNLIADERADATASIVVLDSYRPDFVILDHYFMTQRWIDLLKSSVSARFVVLEDLDRLWNETDYIVNGNLDAKVTLSESSRARVLLGPRYAFLSREYREIRAVNILPVENRQRILVFAGGGNSTDLTAKFLRAASRLPLGIDVVASSTSSNLGELARQVALTRTAILHLDLPSLGPLYAQARLALGAGGTSSWERACLGVPSLVTSVAENQVSVCEALSRHGLAKYIGPSDELDELRLDVTLQELFESPADLKEMSTTGMHVVDGFGTTRTLFAMMGKPEKAVLRKARNADAVVLYSWVNDPEVIRNSKSKRVIPWSDHESWFRRTLTNGDCQLFVLEISGLPVGQIRFDRKEERLVLTYSIDRDFRSQGLGKFIVEQGLRAVSKQGSQMVEAMVRQENMASARVFVRLGFMPSPSEDEEYLRFITKVGD